MVLASHWSDDEYKCLKCTTGSFEKRGDVNLSHETLLLALLDVLADIVGLEISAETRVSRQLALKGCWPMLLKMPRIYYGYVDGAGDTLFRADKVESNRKSQEFLSYICWRYRDLAACIRIFSLTQSVLRVYLQGKNLPSKACAAALSPVAPCFDNKFPQVLTGTETTPEGNSFLGPSPSPPRV